MSWTAGCERSYSPAPHESSLTYHVVQLAPLANLQYLAPRVSLNVDTTPVPWHWKLDQTLLVSLGRRWLSRARPSTTSGWWSWVSRATPASSSRSLPPHHSLHRHGAPHRATYTNRAAHASSTPSPNTSDAYQSSHLRARTLPALPLPLSAIPAHRDGVSGHQELAAHDLVAAGISRRGLTIHAMGL